MKNAALLFPLVAAWLVPAPSGDSFDAEDFETLGSAVVQDDDCIQLTPDAQWVSGAAWAKAPLDLTKPFDLKMSLGFGARDALGADGIVFVLGTEPGKGWRGEGMGYAGVHPSLGIELDTYQNRRQGDPAADHMALLVNGATFHHPQAPVVELGNLEDGKRHAFRVQWDPKQAKLRVYLDGALKATYPGAVVRRVFAARTAARWGLTAGTGRKANPHTVCFDQD